VGKRQSQKVHSLHDVLSHFLERTPIENMKHYILEINPTSVIFVHSVPSHFLERTPLENMKDYILEINPTSVIIVHVHFLELHSYMFVHSALTHFPDLISDHLKAKERIHTGDKPYKFVRCEKLSA
jgi:hypothetical protein